MHLLTGPHNSGGRSDTIREETSLKLCLGISALTVLSRQHGEPLTPGSGKPAEFWSHRNQAEALLPGTGPRSQHRSTSTRTPKAAHPWHGGQTPTFPSTLAQSPALPLACSVSRALPSLHGPRTSHPVDCHLPTVAVFPFADETGLQNLRARPQFRSKEGMQARFQPCDPEVSLPTTEHVRTGLSLDL